MAPRHRHRRALLQDFGRPAVTRLRHHARRLLASLRSRRMDDDFRDEIAGHLAEATDEFVRRGLTPEEARLAALRSFGRVAQIEEIHRDVRAFRLLDDLRQDLRHTRRSLARNPGFTIVAVLTLTLGIGANSTIFTLLDAVVLKPLPLANPQELVTFYENSPEGTPDPSGGTGRYLRFSYGRFERLQHALAPHGLLAATTRSARLVARLPGEAQKRFVSAQFVSGNYFATLGVPAARGRAITSADAAMDRSAPVAVVSDGFWRRSLGGSGDAVGQTLVVNDVGVTVIGVAPRGFFGLWSDAEADLWLPVTLQQPMGYQTNSSSYGPVDPNRPWTTQDVAWLNLVGRVPRRDLAAVLPRLQAANRDGLVALAATIASQKDRTSMLAHTLAAEPLAHGFSGLRARFSDALFVLTGMVVLVLLVTCANIANLQLARAAAHARDMSIRLSLGATTARLVRQCLTESLALALLGGAAGVWVSRWGSSVLARQVLGGSGELPIVFAPDRRVIGFAAAISVCAAIVFGLAPAFRAIAAGRRATLGGNQREPSGDSATAGMRWLVIAQLALSVALVSAALLLGRTLINFMRIDPGFAPAGLVTVSLDPIPSGYPRDQYPALGARLVDAARGVPGVTAAAASTCGLIAGCSSSGGYRVEGIAEPGQTLYRNWVTPEYFTTAGIPLIGGRAFTDRDTANSPRVAVINESAARRYFPGQNPVGRRIGASQLDTEIVGLVHDARTQSLHDLPVPMAYTPLAQKPPNQQPSLTNLDVRVEMPAAAMEPALRAAIHRAEPNLLVGDVAAMSRRIARDLTRERLVAWLAAVFAGMTLLLAAIGLYGVLSYGVARRSREIGVRMALGARPVEVIGMIAAESGRLAIAGMTAGLLGTAVLSRSLAGLLFGIGPLDPSTFVLVTAAFAAVTVLASCIPARRATSVDPIVALRCE